eukprot:scaffold230104_cov33-Tisochrysis_lutea.AAC.3
MCDRPRLRPQLATQNPAHRTGAGIVGMAECGLMVMHAACAGMADPRALRSERACSYVQSTLSHSTRTRTAMTVRWRLSRMAIAHPQGSVRHAETEGDSEREKGHVNPEPVEDESRRQMGIGVSEQ